MTISGTDVVVAAQTIGTTVRRTPLDPAPRLTALTGRPVLLKREDTQIVRSYKVRGAYNFISSLTNEDAARGVVCASAGNHAQGVAFACSHLKIKGTIFIPTTTPRQKRARIRDIGGEWVDIRVVGSTFDEANALAKQFSSESRAVYVAPFDDTRTIAGQGTVVKEIFEQSPERPGTILVPVGGGGLLAGTLAWVKQFHPEVRVIGVETTGAASMLAALEAGGPVTLEKIDTFADGTAVARAGDITYKVISELVDELVTVPEGAVCTEMLELYQVDGVIAEPSGALASAALRGFVDLESLPEGPIVAIISGGNNDVLRYSDIVERSMVYEGLRHYFLVTFPQRPGALRTFLEDVLAEGQDIVLFEYTKKNNRETGPALVGIEIDHREDLPGLLERMEASDIHTELLEPDSAAFEILM